MTSVSQHPSFWEGARKAFPQHTLYSVHLVRLLQKEFIIHHPTAPVLPLTTGRSSGMVYICFYVNVITEFQTHSSYSLPSLSWHLFQSLSRLLGPMQAAAFYPSLYWTEPPQLSAYGRCSDTLTPLRLLVLNTPKVNVLPSLMHTRTQLPHISFPFPMDSCLRAKPNSDQNL